MKLRRNKSEEPEPSEDGENDPAVEAAEGDGEGPTSQMEAIAADARDEEESPSSQTFEWTPPTAAQPAVEADDAVATEPEADAEPAVEVEPEPEPEAAAEPEPVAEAEPEPEPVVEAAPEPEPEPVVAPVPEPDRVIPTIPLADEPPVSVPFEVPAADGSAAAKPQDRPEILVGAAFLGGLLAATILKRFGR